MPFSWIYGKITDLRHTLYERGVFKAESLGAPAVYPFDPAAAVIDKLAFVHQQIRAHARRDRFYASN